MRRTVAVVASLLLLVVGAAGSAAKSVESSAKAAEILGKARTAIRAVDAVRYTATATPGGKAPVRREGMAGSSTTKTPLSSRRRIKRP